jgi:hypothetical protein
MCVGSAEKDRLRRGTDSAPVAAEEEDEEEEERLGSRALWSCPPSTTSKILQKRSVLKCVCVRVWVSGIVRK